MPPFLQPQPIITGVKERIDALTVQGDRLYIGTALGNLHVYGLDETAEDGEEHASLMETKQNLCRRAIEQLGFVKDINSLVVLSEMTVTLHPIPALTPAVPLAQAKAAFSFGIQSLVQHILPNGKVEQPSDVGFGRSQAIPALITRLVVGCRRKVVIYSWQDGEAKDTREVPLPHSARSINFINEDTACFAYSPTEYAIFSFTTMSAIDVQLPASTIAASTTMGALTGLSGYMTLGLGSKPKPAACQINDTESLVVKDNEGIFIGQDAKPSRTSTMVWPAPPEEIALVKPYVISLLPAGAIQATDDSSNPVTTSPVPSLQIRSSLSQAAPQTIPLPFQSGASPCTPRLLTPSSSAKSPVFVVTAPTDRTAASTEGSTIWRMDMKTWPQQIDEFVEQGQYSDALSILETLDPAVLPDKTERMIRIRSLNAVSQFRSGNYDAAIDTFLELDINPAKVVALYPEAISGRLSVPEDRWIPLFGGPEPPPDPAKNIVDSPNETEPEPEPEALKDKVLADISDKMSVLSASGSLRGRWKTSLGALMVGVAPVVKEDDAASIKSSAPRTPPRANSLKRSTIQDDVHKAVETLIRFLSDRRPKVYPSLAAMGITPQNQLNKIPSLSETPVEELFNLPNLPLSALSSEQLLRFAQIVDTALFKCYLSNRAFLVGTLCKVPNWFEVTEVEEELRERKKFSELKDLYKGKGMHKEALELLRQLGEKEDDTEDRLLPSVSYLQKLGPEHLQLIFDTAQWLFAENSDVAFEIFTSEDVELPRKAVIEYLSDISPLLATRYLEFLIAERQEESQAFHDRLAELYIRTTLNAKRDNKQEDIEEQYGKLLKFLDTTELYNVGRIYGIISSEELYEARAILLGRLGRHDQALDLLVHRLQDYLGAEEYCKRYYVANTETSDIFLTLLRIYLRPSHQTSGDFLGPALDLISRHSPRIDTVETLRLLPPLVTTQDLRTFLIEALRSPTFDTRVRRQISKARNDQVSRGLVAMQSKRVKVTDSRICPQCNKRINSVIAVHSPRGEVTHYQCREAFAQRLKATL